MVKNQTERHTVISKRLGLGLLFGTGAGHDDDIGPVIIVVILLVFIDEHITIRDLDWVSGRWNDIKRVGPMVGRLTLSIYEVAAQEAVCSEWTGKWGKRE